MNPPVHPSALSGDIDPVVAELIEDLANRVQAGERVDAEAVIAAHPEHAEQLRRLLPAVEVLADLGRSASAAGTAPPQVGNDADPATGILGDFRIVREVGRGGMGIVYEAEQISLGRRVALKVLPFAATMDPRHLQRFHNEARAAAGLHHEHIVPVYAVGHERAVHFYAMQFIDGQTLTQLVAAQKSAAGPASADVRRAPPAPGHPAPPTPETAVALPAAASTVPTLQRPARYRAVAELGVQAAEALEHAHSLGVVHRDVKPANLMIDGQGKLWVTDFGLARFGAEPGLTMTGDVVGTLRYMSPEQALAKHGLVDHRTDVYALGATLYELLTLRPLVDGKDREDILRKVAFDEPAPPRRWDRSIPHDLEVIVLKATAKEPAERYATAQELADDLGRWLNGKPIQARQIGRFRRLWRWCRRNRVVAALSGVVALLLTATIVALSAGVVLLSNETEEKEKQRQAAAREKDLADAERGRAVQNSRALRREVYAADMDRAYRLASSTHGSYSHDLLSRYEPGDGDEDLRGFEWYYLQWLERGGAAGRRVLRGHLGAVYSVAFAPDGKTLATAGHDTLIRLWDPATEKLRSALLGHLGKVGAVAFAPDGKTLASASDDKTVKLWDTTSGRARATLRGHTDRVYSVAFSPDGSLVASGGLDRSIRLWDTTRGNEQARWQADDIVVESLAFSPDGKFLATGGGDANVKLWELQFDRQRVSGQRLVAVFAVHARAALCVRFSHDGRLLATSDNMGSVLLFDARRHVPIAGWRGVLGGDHLTSLAFSPNDLLLAAAGADPPVCLWELPIGRLHQVFRGHREHVRAVAFSSDGETLASGSSDGTVRLWAVERSPGHVTLPELAHPVTCLACSPDGHTLTTRTAQGDLAWWEITGEPRLLKEVQPTQPAQEVTAAAGRFVAVRGPTNSLRVCDLITGNDRPVSFAVREDPTWKAVLSPDGTRLVAAKEDRSLWLIDLAGGTQRMIVPRSDHDCRLAAFTADGKALVVSRVLERQYLLDIASGSELYPLNMDIGAFASSPGREWLAAGDADGSIRLCDGASGQVRHTLLFHRGAVNAVAFSPDRKTLASAGNDGQVKLWQVETGRELFTLQDNPGENVCCVAFSSDGQVLAAGGSSRGGKGFVRLWYGPRGAKGK